MKNRKTIFLGILTVILVMVFTACSDGGGNMFYSIGDIGPGGGYVFYDKGDYSGGWRYLEAAPADISGIHAWASSGFTTTNIPDTGTAIGTGRQNTALILALDANAPAALACRNYSNNSFTDWFLPSYFELVLMYYNLHNKSTDKYLFSY